MLSLNQIHGGDATKLLLEIPDESIDLIVTSPPYGIGMPYEEAQPWDQYKEWVKTWISQTQRILKPSGSFFLNIGHMTVGPCQKVPLTYLYYELRPMPLIQEIVWNFPSGNDASRRRFCCRSERWMWFARNPGNHFFNLDAVRIATKHIKDKRNNPKGANPTDVWFYDQIRNNSQEKYEMAGKRHPCQYPRSMIYRIIASTSFVGAIVLDPFCGSGTTCYISKQLKRNYIGIEFFPPYVKMARRRLETDLEAFV